MNTHLSSVQLKSIAKGQLLGKYGTAISVSLAVGMIMLALSFIFSFVLDMTTTTGLVISYLVQLIFEILSGIFTVGICRFYLNIACEQPYSITDAFSGFRWHADRAICVKFIVIILELICFVPAIICIFIYQSSTSPLVFLITCILLVAGGILYTYLSLIFSQSFFLIVDFPEYSAKKILDASRQVMKGNKARLFYIRISLIPFYILGIISCCIAFLWIEPYVNAIFTNFYLDLMRADGQPDIRPAGQAVDVCV